MSKFRYRQDLAQKTRYVERPVFVPSVNAPHYRNDGPFSERFAMECMEWRLTAGTLPHKSLPGPICCFHCVTVLPLREVRQLRRDFEETQAGRVLPCPFCGWRTLLLLPRALLRNEARGFSREVSVRAILRFLYQRWCYYVSWGGGKVA